MAIFKSSLPRTLEAHRSSNRTSLVRKVFDRTDLARSVTPVEEALALKRPGKPVSPEATTQIVSSRPSTRTASNIRTLKNVPVNTTQTIPCDQMRWGVNTEQCRWEQSPWMDYGDASREWPDAFLQLDAEIRALEEYLLPTPPERDRHCSSFSGRIQLSGKWNSILTAVHHETGIRVQFQCGEGLPSSVEYICDYYTEYPAIRPLYMVIRLILEAQELFGSHKSSIGPDSLVMLIVAFLKMKHGRFQESRSLGQQLLAFLKVYGSEVDLRSTCVSVDPPSFFDASTVKDAIKMYDAEDLPAHLRGQRALVNRKKTAAIKRNIPAASRLCLQDPANYMNDLGRTCSRTCELQDVFLRAYDRLNTCLGAWERHTHGGLRNSLLAPVLRANFDDFSKVRGQIT
ncbi:hypothetical protein APSETT444_005348 [Aspergillus pseudonomiae]